MRYRPILAVVAFFILLVVLGTVLLGSAPSYRPYINTILLPGCVALFAHFVSFMYESRRRRMIEKGAIRFENIVLLTKASAEAVKVALLGTYMLGVLCLSATLLIFALFPGTVPNVEGLLNLVFTSVGVGIAFFCTAFLATYIHHGDTYQNYYIHGRGARPMTELLVGQEGLRGMLDLDWQEVENVVAKNERMVLLRTRRKPRWLLSIFHANTLLLAFDSPEDARAFIDSCTNVRHS